MKTVPVFIVFSEATYEGCSRPQEAYWTEQEAIDRCAVLNEPLRSGRFGYFYEELEIDGQPVTKEVFEGIYNYGHVDGLDDYRNGSGRGVDHAWDLFNGAVK